METNESASFCGFGDVSSALFACRTAHGFEMFDGGSRPLVVGGTVADRVSHVPRRPANGANKSVRKYTVLNMKCFEFVGVRTRRR